MSKTAKVSLLANVGLCAIILWLTQHKRVDVALQIRPTAKADSANEASSSESGRRDTSASPQLTIPDPTPAKSTTPRSTSPQFRWSMLESSDYRQYIANLRSIACPEQTIRDIITADVAALYARKREKLARQEGNEAALQTEFQLLEHEEQLVIAALLAPASSSNQEPAPAPPPRLVRRDPIEYPLAFQAVDPERMPLNPTQSEILSNLRQQFQEDIGDQSDPDDPAYHQRWLDAQRKSDDQLRGMLGEKFFISYQLQAAQQAEQLDQSK